MRYLSASAETNYAYSQLSCRQHESRVPPERAEDPHCGPGHRGTRLLKWAGRRQARLTRHSPSCRRMSAGVFLVADLLSWMLVNKRAAKDRQACCDEGGGGRGGQSMAMGRNAR